MFFHMITLFLFLSLLILLIRIFSARLIIPAVGVFLPVSSLWMGFHMLTQNESCLDNIACVAPPFGQFSTLIGWFLIAESILTACAGVYFLRKIKNAGHVMIQSCFFLQVAWQFSVRGCWNTNGFELPLTVLLVLILIDWIKS